MLPLKKILCPTDFSDPSFEAMKVATELALHFFLRADCYPRCCADSRYRNGVHEFGSF